MTVRIVIADDHKIVREGLRWMLEDEPAIDIVGEADSGAALIELLDRVEVDIVLLDVRMPGMTGLEALETMRRTSPEVRVVILSMHDEPAYVRRAVELGAAGYLLKSADRDELVTALREVAEGGSYVQGAVAGTLMDSLSGRGRAGTVLSDREREILKLVANGFENKQIASELGISEATVKTHLKATFARLDVASRAEAVAVGLRLGLID